LSFLEGAAAGGARGATCGEADLAGGPFRMPAIKAARRSTVGPAAPFDSETREAVGAAAVGRSSVAGAGVGSGPSAVGAVSTLAVGRDRSAVISAARRSGAAVGSWAAAPVGTETGSGDDADGVDEPAGEDAGPFAAGADRERSAAMRADRSGTSGSGSGSERGSADAFGFDRMAAKSAERTSADPVGSPSVDVAVAEALDDADVGEARALTASEVGAALARSDARLARSLTDT
jgi:hypothetical protein